MNSPTAGSGRTPTLPRTTAIASPIWTVPWLWSMLDSFRYSGADMATSIEPALVALAGTVVGGLISFTATAWTERRRLADTRAFRNYAERVRAATEYLTTFDNYRRCIRDGRGSECNDLARAHSSAIILLELFFDHSIRDAAEEARDCLIRMNANPSERKSLDREAQAARAKVIKMFREPLGVTDPSTSG